MLGLIFNSCGHQPHFRKHHIYITHLLVTFCPVNQMPGGPDPEAVLRHCARLISNGVGDPTSKGTCVVEDWLKFQWSYIQIFIWHMDWTSHTTFFWNYHELSSVNIMQGIFSIQDQMGCTYRSWVFWSNGDGNIFHISFGTCLTSCSSMFFKCSVFSCVLTCMHESREPLHEKLQTLPKSCNIHWTPEFVFNGRWWRWHSCGASILQLPFLGEETCGWPKGWFCWSAPSQVTRRLIQDIGPSDTWWFQSWNPQNPLIDFYVMVLFPHSHRQGFRKNRFQWMDSRLQKTIFWTQMP